MDQHRLLLVALPLKHREEGKTTEWSPDEDRQALFSFLADKAAGKFKPGQVQMVPFYCQDFKVGTLDSLVCVGEDLGRIDQGFEGVLERLHGHLKNLASAFPEEPIDDAVLVDEMPYPEYLGGFQWNGMKYRTDQPVKEIVEALAGEASQMDNLVKAKMNAFYQAKGEIDAQVKSKSGSLAVRDLSDILSGMDATAGSEFMETLAMVIPKYQREVWEAGYERIAEMVVPGSSALVAEDGDFLLYTVTLFKKYKGDFIKNCAKLKYTVRELTPSGSSTRSTGELKAMEGNLYAQWTNLVRLVQSNLGDAYAAYTHLKAVRLFVESVLRYGLPAEYLYLLITVSDPKSQKPFEKRFLQSLETLKLPGISLVELSTALHSLGVAVEEMDVEEQELWSALNMNSKDFDPYVKLVIKGSASPGALEMDGFPSAEEESRTFDDVNLNLLINTYTDGHYISLGTKAFGLLHETVRHEVGQASQRILLGDRDNLPAVIFAERLGGEVTLKTGLPKCILSLSVPEKVLKGQSSPLVDWVKEHL